MICLNKFPNKYLQPRSPGVKNQARVGEACGWRTSSIFASVVA